MTSREPDHRRRRQAVEVALAAAGLDANLTDELQYMDRYRVLQGNKKATVDVIYDRKGRITGVEPGGSTGNGDLVLGSICAIEELPTELLRPRFSNRLASPAVLIERHTEAFESVGIDVCGIRFSPYQITYDLEDPALGPAARAMQLFVRYNSRGVVTWASCTDEPLGHAAVEAIGVGDLIEYVSAELPSIEADGGGTA